MKKLNVPLILDTLFTAAAAFLLFFTAIRHYAKSAYIALPFAVCAALLFGALAFLVISGRQKKQKQVYGNAREREKLKIHLSLLTRSEAARLVLPCLGEGAKVERYRICANERVYYPLFTFEKLGEGDVASVIRRRADRQKVILCNGCTPEAENLAKRFNIEIIGTDELFDRLKADGNLPEKYLCEDVAKSGALKVIKQRFGKKLASPLFFSGAALIIFSYFTFFPVYYIAVGSLLLVLSVASLFIG